MITISRSRTWSKKKDISKSDKDRYKNWKRKRKEGKGGRDGDKRS